MTRELTRDRNLSLERSGAQSCLKSRNVAFASLYFRSNTACWYHLDLILDRTISCAGGDRRGQKRKNLMFDYYAINKM